MQIRPVLACAAASAVLLTLAASCSRKDPERPAPAASDPSTRQVEQTPETYRVKLDTTKGNITIEVNRSWAPRGADRFFELVNARFYDQARFFRVLPGFVVQFGLNGDPKVNQLWNTQRIPDDPVKQSNARGTVTFAKAGPNTRTTQVFINLVDNSAKLDGQGFAPFGKVVEGMEVVDSLYSAYGEGAPRGSGPDQSMIQTQGNEYLTRQFPRLDYIQLARVEK